MPVLRRRFFKSLRFFKIFSKNTCISEKTVIQYFGMEIMHYTHHLSFGRVPARKGAVGPGVDGGGGRAALTWAAAEKLK